MIQSHKLKKMKKLTFIVSLFILVGCSKDDDVPPQYNFIENYHVDYMNYNITPINLVDYGNWLVELEYSNNKIVRRSGAVIEAASIASTEFTYNTYDELTYDADKITIEKKNVYNESHSLTTIINLDGDKMIKKVQIYPWNDSIKTAYTYNSDNLLIKTYNEEIDYNNKLLFFEDATFYYNSSKNLDSIVTIRQSYLSSSVPNYEPSIEEFTPYKKVVEIFSDYDTSKNLAKNLFIFEETFTRSLSENNYGRYEKHTYNANNGGPFQLISKEGQIWDLQYDSDGNILFNTF